MNIKKPFKGSSGEVYKGSRLVISNWRRFYIAYALELGGGRFLDVIIPVLSVAIASGAGYAGIFLFVASIPRLMLPISFVSTMVRHPKISWCAVGSAMQGLGTIALFAALWSSGGVFLAVIVVSALLYGIGGSIYGMAVMPTIKSLVRNEALAEANARLEILDSALTVCIPILAGFMLAGIGPAWTLMLTVAFYTSSSILRVDLPMVQESAGRSDSENQVREDGVQMEVFENARPLISFTVLRYPFMGSERRFVSIVSLVIAVSSLLVIPLAAVEIEIAGGDSEELGFAFSAAGLGGILMAYMAGKSKKILDSLFVLLLALSLALLFLVSITSAGSVWVIILLVGLMDSFASWCYVAVPYLRMVMEDEKDLALISGGQMIYGGILSALAGACLGVFGRPEMLPIFIYLFCGIALAIAVITYFGVRLRVR